jgi:hypothetical protein
MAWSQAEFIVESSPEAFAPAIVATVGFGRGGVVGPLLPIERFDVLDTRSAGMPNPSVESWVRTSLSTNWSTSRTAPLAPLLLNPTLSVLGSPAITAQSTYIDAFVLAAENPRGPFPAGQLMWSRLLAFWSTSALESILTVCTAPVVTSWGPGRLDVFAFGREADNGPGTHLLHWWLDQPYNQNTWANEVLQTSETEGFLDSPCVVSWGPQRLDVFAGDVQSNLFHWYFDGAHGINFGVPETLEQGGTLPAAASLAPNRIDVVAMSPAQNLLHWYCDGPTGFGTPNGLPGSDALDLDQFLPAACVVSKPGVLDVLTTINGQPARWRTVSHVDTLVPARNPFPSFNLPDNVTIVSPFAAVSAHSSYPFVGPASAENIELVAVCQANDLVIDAQSVTGTIIGHWSWNYP